MVSSDDSFSDKENHYQKLSNQIDDENLAALAAGGHNDAFEQLILRYQDRIFNLFFQQSHSRSEAEDLSQETFMKAFKAICNFRQQSKFYTWLFRIAINTGISRGRQVTRLKEREGVRYDATIPQNANSDSNSASMQFAADDKLNPKQQFERSAVREQVRCALGKLTDDYKTILVLRDMEGLNYETISATLSISTAAVKSRLHRARSQLAQVLKDLRPERPHSE